MDTIYPYQVHMIILPLSRMAQAFEDAGNPAWFALASAAACLERMLAGETPEDLEEVAQRLKDLKVPDPHYRQPGKNYFFTVEMAIMIIDGVRLGIFKVQPRDNTTPVWIGLDFGRGDRTVFHAQRGGRHHA